MFTQALRWRAGERAAPQRRRQAPGPKAQAPGPGTPNEADNPRSASHMPHGSKQVGPRHMFHDYQILRGAPRFEPAPCPSSTRTPIGANEQLRAHMPFNFAAATISAALRIESPSSTIANVAEPLPHKSTSALPSASCATPGWDASHSRVSASAGSTCSDAAARLLNNGNSAADSIASVDSACRTAASSSNAAYAAFVDTPSSIFTRTTVPRAGSNVRSSTSPFSPSCTQPP